MAENLNERDVEGVRRSDATRGSGKRPGQGPDGYGRKIATDWEVRVGGKWHRVYVVQFSNAGSAYVVRGGRDLYLGSFEPSSWDEEWYQSYRERQGWPTSHSIKVSRVRKR